MFTPFATTSISERRAEVGDARGGSPARRAARNANGSPSTAICRYWTAYSAVCPSTPISRDERLCGEPEGDCDGGPERERQPERLRAEAVALSPARPHPTARVTCEVVPYARKLNIAKAPPSTSAGGAERRELRGAEVADDRRVDEHVGRLCGERPEREDGEAKDLAVVRRAPAARRSLDRGASYAAR